MKYHCKIYAIFFFIFCLFVASKKGFSQEQDFRCKKITRNIEDNGEVTVDIYEIVCVTGQLLDGDENETGILTAAFSNDPTDSERIFTCSDRGPLNFVIAIFLDGQFFRNCFAILTIGDQCGFCIGSQLPCNPNPNRYPSIICPDNVSVFIHSGSCVTNNVNLGFPSFSDDCNYFNISATNDAPSAYPIGETIVTWQIDDGFGNMTICDQIVTVNGESEECCYPDLILDGSELISNVYQASNKIRVEEIIPSLINVVFDAPVVEFSPSLKISLGAIVETEEEGCNVVNDFKLFATIGDKLVTVDTQTGLLTMICEITTGYNIGRELTYHPFLEKLISSCTLDGEPFLISIDICTGQVEEVGLIDQNEPPLDFKIFEALEYNYEDGLLYGAGYEFLPSNNFFSRRIVTVDPTTGNASPVSTIGSTCQIDVDGMAFSATQQFIWDSCHPPEFNREDHLYSVDLTTGSVSFIGVISETTSVNAINNINDELYASFLNERKLYKINTKDASAELIGNTHLETDFNGEQISQLVFAPLDCE